MTTTVKKEYLSYSQISLWDGGHGKKEYIKQYFMGIKPPTSPQMHNGSIVHDRLPDMLNLPQNEVNEFEYKIDLDIAGIRCLGYFDRLDFTNKVIYEYKTGKQWTDDAVQNHKQLHMYYLLYLKRFDEEPEKIILAHISSDCTITEFEYRPDSAKIEAFINEIKEARAGIDEAYDEYMSNKSDVEYISSRLTELAIKIDDLEDEQAVLKNRLIGLYPDGYANDFINLYKINKVSKEYPAEFDDEVASIKDKYANLCIKKETTSYGIKYNNKTK